MRNNSMVKNKVSSFLFLYDLDHLCITVPEASRLLIYLPHVIDDFLSGEIS